MRTTGLGAVERRGALDYTLVQPMVTIGGAPARVEFSGLAPGWLLPVVAAHTVAWFAAEAWFLAGYGLPFGPRAWAAASSAERATLIVTLTSTSGCGATVTV